tara:strand:- start:43 stop:213 length:171 start_codon:yes stop_codon:yes gene_type:complete
MKGLLLFLFLISCVLPNANTKVKDKDLNFNEYLTFNEFKELLIKYARKTPYPNIDK